MSRLGSLCDPCRAMRTRLMLSLMTLLILDMEVFG